jgi:hypothetical protein
MELVGEARGLGADIVGEWAETRWRMGAYIYAAKML